MATATLQSFNVFLTDRLTAAAVDIYGFVERTILDYQEEVNRTKLENQRLQRLLDLVYKPEIRLHRADSRQIDLPIPTQEVSAQPQQIEKECIPSAAKEDPVILSIKEEKAEPCTSSAVPVVMHDNRAIPDKLTGIVTFRAHAKYEAPESLTQATSIKMHREYEIPSQELLSSFGTLPYLFLCNICNQPFLTEVELKLHHAIHSSPTTNNLRTHSNERSFVCPICGNRYKLQGHMKGHIRAHTGERPYTCYICGRGFNRSTIMSKHARIKHMENLPYKCMQCSRHFPLLGHIKQHMKPIHDITFSV